MEKAYLQRKRQYGELAKWIDMDAFLMALRLRRKGIIYPDVETVFGEILMAMVQTATRLLIREEPEYAQHKKLFLEPDTQSLMLLLLLQKLDLVDTSMTSPQALKFILKTVKSRLKNFVRDTYGVAKRNPKKCAGSIDDLSVMPICTDFFGQVRKSTDSGKVSTQNLNK